MISHYMYKVYKLNSDSLPNKTIMRHTCDNPKCINPDHLLPGTQKENMQDMKERNRGNYLTGIYNHNTKLKEEQVIDIFTNTALNGSELGRKYNIKPQSVELIKKRKNWKWLTKNINR